MTFFTEVAIIVAGFQAGLVWPFALGCVLLLVVFAGIARQVLRMTLGGGDAGARASDDGRRPPWWRQLPIGVALAVSAGLGFAAWPLAGVLGQAVVALGGGR